MELFVRSIQNQIKYKEFVNSISKQLNLSNLQNFSRKKIIKLFDKKYENEYLIYRFSLLKEWIKNNERYNKEYINNLENIIDRLMLKEFLTGFELDYLDHYNQVVFSKTRNLKNLLVDFDMDKKENAYFKFDFDVFGRCLSENNVQIFFENGEVYVTTKRIVIVDKDNYYSIFYNDINSLKLKNYYFEVQANNDLKFYLFSKNIHAFYVGLERVLNLCKIRI